MSTNDSLDRRGFLKSVSATGLTLTAATSAIAAKTASKMSGGRVIGANDRINVGVIGCGGRGSYVADAFAEFGEEHNNACQIVAVCDVYEKRKRRSGREAQRAKATWTTANCSTQPDIDAVSSPRPTTGTARSRWTPWTRARTSTSKSPWATPTRKPASWSTR